MATIIPITPGDPDQPLSITLDDRQYLLRFRWNSRDDDGKGAWYMDAWESDGVTSIAFGVKVVLGTLLGKTVSHPLFSAGIFALDYSGTGEEARLNDLGGRVVVVHFNLADRILSSLPAP